MVNTEAFLGLAGRDTPAVAMQTDNYQARDSVGARYNTGVNQANVLGMLLRHGWVVEQESGGVYSMRRPGKKRGTSGLLGIDGDPNYFYCFSSSAAPLEGMRGYDPFGLYTRLEHGGDFHAAASQLSREGYGGVMETAEWVGGPTPSATIEEGTTTKAGTQLQIITGDEVLQVEQTLNWTMKGILLEGGLHYLSGPPAGGKSWLALEMCKVITTGGKFFRTYDAPQAACLYIDEEMGAAMTAHRMGLIGFKPAPDFYYLGKQGFHLGNQAHRDEVLAFAKMKGIRFIVFDTLRGCCPGLKENESEHVTRLRSWFGAYTREGITLLVLHHDRKSQNGEHDAGYERMAGSADFAGMADMAYAIDKSQGVHHLKVSKNRLLPEDQAVSVHYELKQVGEKEVAFEVVNMREKASELLEEISKDVLTVLRERGKMKPTMIAAQMGLSSTETGNALAWLYAREYVSKDKEGYYEWQPMF